MSNKAEDCIRLCEIGDILYRVGKHGIEKITITQIHQYPHCVYKDNQGHSYFNRNINKTCFKTEKEAEEEMQKRDRIIEKRKLLKEYEKELNEKLNIVDHYIVK